MVAKIITVINQKGGVGKSTVCCSIAGALGKRNKKILVVDLDPQGTATRWLTKASDDNQFPARVINLAAAGEYVHREIRKYIDAYDYILIDTPSSVESFAAQRALLVSDLAIVPIIPSGPDLDATKAIKRLLESAQINNESLKILVLAVQCQNTNLAKSVLDMLNSYELPIANTTIGCRTVFREAYAFGCTVYEFGARARLAIDEINRFIIEVQNCLTTEPCEEADA